MRILVISIYDGGYNKSVAILEDGKLIEGYSEKFDLIMICEDGNIEIGKSIDDFDSYTQSSINDVLN